MKVQRIGQGEGAFRPSDVTGHLLRQREWQRETLAAAAREQTLRRAGIEPSLTIALVRGLRLPARLGGVMVAAGRRLQGIEPGGMRPAGELG